MATIRIGIAGIGFMGMIHYLAAQRAEGVTVAALQSRSAKKRAGDWTDIQGNFGPRGGMMDLSGVRVHERFEDLLADETVDLVDLCVPNPEHSRLAIQALEAGKDVLVEKPIALRVDDADAMIAAARRFGRLVMVAHILPFFPEFEFAYQAVASGEHGRLLAAHFTRVISRPDWGNAGDFVSGGGPAIDLHVHDTHFVDLVCGPPRAVRSRGVVESGVVIHLDTHYHYPDGGPIVSAVSGALATAGRPFSHGFELYLERATLSFRFDNLADEPRLSPLTIIHANGQIERPQLGSGDPIDAFARELEEAGRAVAGRVESQMLSASRARRALRSCLAEVESVLTGLAVNLSDSE